MAQSKHRMHGARARPPAQAKGLLRRSDAPASDLAHGAFDLPLAAPAHEPEERDDGDENDNKCNNNSNDDIDVIVADVLGVVVVHVHVGVGRDVQLEAVRELCSVSVAPPPPHPTEPSSAVILTGFARLEGRQRRAHS